MREEVAPRIEWVDFAKGVVIILVVLGHAEIPDANVNKFFAAFRMPFFFVMAGFLLNLNKWSGAENYKNFSSKLFKRLLVPYYLAEILWYPIWFIVCHESGYLKYAGAWCEITPFDAFTAIFIGNGNGVGLVLGPLWFLPALLAAEIIFVKLFNRLNKIGTEVFIVAIFTMASLGFNMKNLFVLPMGIDIALAAQIFILAGILIRRYNLVDKLTPINCGVLTLILFIAFGFNDRVDMNFRHYGNALLFYAGGISGTLIVMKISALMTCGKIFSLISRCGRQSMMILVLHPITANIFYEIIARNTNFPPENFFTEPIIIFAVTAAGVLIPLFIAEKFGKLPIVKYFCP